MEDKLALTQQQDMKTSVKVREMQWTINTNRFTPQIVIRHLSFIVDPLM